MSDSKDIIEKTDAFLKRYHPSPKAKQEDIPVLTDVVTEPSPPAVEATQPSTPQATPAKSLVDAAIPRVIAALEGPLKQHIETHLGRVLPALTEQIRRDIEALVRETVARAVEQEIARLRSASRDARP